MIDTAELRKKWRGVKKSFTFSTREVGRDLFAALDEIDRLRVIVAGPMVGCHDPKWAQLWEENTALRAQVEKNAKDRTYLLAKLCTHPRIITDPEKAVRVWLDDRSGGSEEMIRTGRLLVVEPEEDWPSCVTRPAGCGRELLTAIQRHDAGLCRCGKATP